jgi:hypothetical protein
MFYLPQRRSDYWVGSTTELRLPQFRAGDATGWLPGGAGVSLTLILSIWALPNDRNEFVSNQELARSKSFHCYIATNSRGPVKSSDLLAVTWIKDIVQQ